ncbi:MAG: hypothetical protein MUF42_13435 [Cytophagaceae bacterium]|jgi:hypothetical protein|nr:hypothetical protein [Cytophagaceae bacterium]
MEVVGAKHFLYFQAPIKSNMDIQSILKESFTGFPESSKLWVYQASQSLSPEQEAKLLQRLELFLQDWTNHGNQLKADGKFLFGRFLVLVVDESKVPASGCSIDASMRLVKELEQLLEIRFTDRMMLVYLSEEIHSCPLQELPAEVHEGTLIFNPMVSTLGDWRNSWLSPLHKTWVRRFLKANNPIFSPIK